MVIGQYLLSNCAVHIPEYRSRHQEPNLKISKSKCSYVTGYYLKTIRISVVRSTEPARPGRFPVKFESKCEILTYMEEYNKNVKIRNIGGRDSSVGIATRYGLDSPGIETRWRMRFSAPVHTHRRAHASSYTMGTGSFPGLKRPGSGVDHPPHLVPG